MATNVVYNVFNSDDCVVESMTKEQIYELIANSIAQGELAGVDPEKPFITKIKEQNKGVPLKFWLGTQAEYNAIEEKEENCFYIITDSTVQEDIENSLAELQTSNANIVDTLKTYNGLLNFANFLRSSLVDAIYYSIGIMGSEYNITINNNEQLVLNDENGTYVAEVHGTVDPLPITYSTFPDYYNLETIKTSSGSGTSYTKIKITNNSDKPGLCYISSGRG